MNKSFVLGFFLSLLFVMACSSFPYKWYGLDCGDCDGTMMAKEPKDDLPLTTCKADDQAKGKCAVMTFTEMDRLRSDYIEMAERLKNCEHANK